MKEELAILKKYQKQNNKDKNSSLERISDLKRQRKESKMSKKQRQSRLNRELDQADS